MKATITLFLLCVAATIFCWKEPWILDSVSFSSDNLAQGKVWTLVTSLFIHGSIWHLLGNMLALLVFGFPLEKLIGTKKLFLTFLVGGVGSLLIGRLYYPANEYLIGASGAICTMIAVLILFDPWRVSFILTILPMPLGAAGIVYMLFNVYLAGKAHFNPNDNMAKIAYELHVIGFAIGIILGALWSPKWIRNLFISILLFVLTCIIYALLFRYVFVKL
jgi:membrane associated rhomboid family serine protease